MRVMDRPVSLFEGRVLLLSPPDSFNAAYIRRSLQFWGVSVFTPAGRPTEAFSSLTLEDWQSVTACVAVDLDRAMFADVSTRQPGVPFVFVGHESGSWFPGPYSWLSPPFASHQVFDALTHMISAVGSTMEKMIEFSSGQPVRPDSNLTDK